MVWHPVEVGRLSDKRHYHIWLYHRDEQCVICPLHGNPKSSSGDGKPIATWAKMGRPVIYRAGQVPKRENDAFYEPIPYAEKFLFGVNSVNAFISAEALFEIAGSTRPSRKGTKAQEPYTRFVAPARS